MTDRIPGAPGQYKATVTAAELEKMQNGEAFTITMTRDDQPIVEGTPYNKASVLPDDLAALICPGVSDPSPADAMRSMHNRLQGTAPGGYGLGETARFIENNQLLSSATETGFYRWAGGNTDPDNPFGSNTPGSMIVIKRSSTYVTQIATRDDTENVLLKMRKMVEGAWGPWGELYTYNAILRLNPDVHYGASLPDPGTPGRIFFLTQ